MRGIDRRIVIAALLAVGACSDADGGEETSVDENPSTASSRDAGRDGGRGRDGGFSYQEPGREDDDDDDELDEAPRADAGRRDAGDERDAGAPRDASTPPTDDSVPDGDHCADTADWDPAWAEFEDEVLRLTNEARAAGANCGAEGVKPPVGPLTMEPRLRCAARLYSKDMADTGNWGHTGADGSEPADRVSATGYRWTMVGENIAKLQETPAKVVADWLESDGHCNNIMHPDFQQIGIGYFAKAVSGPRPRTEAYWTQNFARSRR